ncbi:MAG: PadR family transcriptional regulator [Acidimicrobiales bacterium]
MELAILGMLKEHDLHGYELKRRLATTLGVWSAVSFGSLYPALARLERAGAVEVVGSDPPRAPMTGSLDGERAAFRPGKAGALGIRGKKVYSITAAGHGLFEELLAEGARSSDDGRGFSLRLAFARHLSPDARLRLLERRRAELVQRLSHQSAPSDETDSYARSLIEHGIQSTERDISWLDRLIADERRPVKVKSGSTGNRGTISKGNL